MKSTVDSPAEAIEPPFLAGHVALDFINSAFGIGADHRECLASDEQVLAWIERAGIGAAAMPAKSRPGALLQAALELRAGARELVESRKAGEVGAPGQVAALNRVLGLGRAHQELVWSKKLGPCNELRRRVGSAEALLVPIAESLAALLAEGDFELIRKCESDDCTQWFYDQTKSHHRRWCSAAICGNRMKVAAFRARQKAR